MSEFQIALKRQEAQKHINALLNAMDYQKVRLRNGTMRRSAMVSQIEKGERPEGVRADWLRNTVSDVAVTLEVKAIEFNTANADDLISVSDMIDVLTTTISMLQDIARGKK